MKPSGIGGQAVIEGVMMKNKEHYAIAVRKQDNEIIVEKNDYISAAEKYKIFKLPIFRGMLAFVESMIIGTKTLTFSASFFEEEEEVKPSKLEKMFSKIFKEKAEHIAMMLTVLLSGFLAIGIFMIIPYFVAGLLAKQIESSVVLAIIEGCIRILIFIAYIFAISQIKDIKRMFMYHGAEHKTINCLEQGFELNVENVKWQSRQHKRCGTSFMFIVMFVSILFFIFIRVDTVWLRILTRLLLIPVISGVSYEFIRFAGKNNSKVIDILSKPGMWLQGLTTREPDESMIEVAIQSVEAVFDWREFLDEGKSKSNKHSNKLKNNKDKSYKNTDNKDKNNHNKNNNKAVDKNGQNDNQKNRNVNSVKDEATSTNTNKRSSDTTKLASSNKEQAIRVNRKASEETAITMEEAAITKMNRFLDDEEDDEILRALDRYLIDKAEVKEKE